MNNNDERDCAEERYNANLDRDENGCRWFAMCGQPADGYAMAPWGRVPCCRRCADRVGVELVEV